MVLYNNTHNLTKWENKLLKITYGEPLKDE